MTNKLSKNIGIIFKVRHNLSSSTLVMLYRILIQPYCDYCNVVWAAGSSHSLQTLFKKQKKAIRAIVFAKFNAHSKPIFKKTHVLTIHDINKLQTACFVYKAINKLLPPRFSTLYVTNSEIHSHNTSFKHKEA